MTERLEVMRGVIHPWHLDHFGHMNVRHYAPFFDDALYHLWARLGIGYAWMQENFGVHCVTARATTGFVKELVAGDLIVIDAGVARLGEKSVTLQFQMVHAEKGTLHATYEVVEVFFDPVSRSSAPMPAPVRAALQPLVLS